MHYRYELREDKEREARRTFDYFDNLRGDIRMDIQKLSPIPHLKLESSRGDGNKQASPRSGFKTTSNKSTSLQNSPLPSQHLHFDTAHAFRDWETSSSERLTLGPERDQVKQEMMSILREALRDIQTERLQNTFHLNGAGLYQTHLYTQL